MLGVFESVDYCLFRILGELGVSNDKLVQIISKEIGAGIASVAIEHSEKRTFGPIVAGFVVRLHDV